VIGSTFVELAIFGLHMFNYQLKNQAELCTCSHATGFKKTFYFRFSLGDEPRAYDIQWLNTHDADCCSQAAAIKVSQLLVFHPLGFERKFGQKFYA
jgi:hypothetical protein